MWRCLVGLMVFASACVAESGVVDPAIPKVVRGAATTIEGAPFFASLYFANEPGSPSGHQSATFATDLPDCGGAIYSHGAIVTAAHCVEDVANLVRASAAWGAEAESSRTDQRRVTTEQDLMRVVVGSDRSSRSNLPDSAQEPTIAPDGILVHPCWGSEPTKFGRAAFDIAVIRLSSSLRWTPEVQPIALVAQSEQALVFPGRTADIVGFGDTAPDGSVDEELPEVPSKLQRATVRMQSAVTVDTAVREESAIVAVGDRGEDACVGDSGGPLFSGNGSDATLLGLVSDSPVASTIDCGGPGLYASVLLGAEWIQRAAVAKPGAAAETCWEATRGGRHR